MATVTTNSTFYPIATTVFGTTSPVTGAAPSDPLDGLPTGNLQAVTITVTVEAAQTLSGAGSLQAYEYSVALGRWVRVPSADISLTTSGVRDLEAGVVLPSPFMNAQRTATRVQYVPSAVTFSGGSAGVTITLVGTKAQAISTGTGV